MSTMLPVNEIFHTIQGEAFYTGTPATFVRLQGCPVGCAWCDTKHTWELNDQVDSIIGKDSDSPSHALMSNDDISQAVRQNHVVITGGEPCLYDLRPVTQQLIDNGHTVQIETSGTHEILCSDEVFVTLSPKLEMPGGFDVLDSSYHRADEIKFPVGNTTDISKLTKAVEPHVSHCQIWLQPLSENRKATALCVAMAKANEWRLSVQTHKTIGIR